ncbi:YwqJ-related putative deaminase [Xenorhabdus sp. XENO-7]|uniref:YwqJ-related putative deaminase n=1 Tax=Xenorhabdus aichiensis TaxID=3025874 RepID=A0ABT5M0X8_9GAMM|nr:YwqJ-related putative deaminase [Xenorhabdus aichiensis]MDC9621319.1 YwqJ-related putative deaminase [Xenorhabdus aichiensis]
MTIIEKKIVGSYMPYATYLNDKDINLKNAFSYHDNSEVGAHSNELSELSENNKESRAEYTSNEPRAPERMMTYPYNAISSSWHAQGENRINVGDSVNKQGLNTVLDVLHLDKPDTEKVAADYQRKFFSKEMTTFQNKTDLILTESQKTPKTKSPGMKKYTKNALKDFAAHAGYLHNGSYQDEFVNFKDKKQNLAPGKLFPGVELLPQKTIEINRPAGCWQSKRSYDIEDEFRNNMANEYQVQDTSKFISGLKSMYEKSGQTLHPMTQRLVEEHIAHNGNILPTMAGIAGLHAEVQALNKVFIESDETSGQSSSPLNPARYARAMLQSSIFTKRLTTANAGNDFPACHNCSGIIQSPANVITGMVGSAGSNFSAQRSKRHRSQSLSE